MKFGLLRHELRHRRPPRREAEGEAVAGQLPPRAPESGQGGVGPLLGAGDEVEGGGFR